MVIISKGGIIAKDDLEYGSKQSLSILSYLSVHLEGPRETTKNYRYPTPETSFEIWTT
jgi:hypothetical protein